MKRRAPYDDADPAEVAWVSVRCTEESHAEDPWNIATYYIDWEGPPWPDGTPYWAEYRGSYLTPEGKESVFGTAKTRTSLVGDTPESDARKLNVPESRSRYSLKCRRCGLSLVRKAQDFDRALLLMHLAGLREVSLRGLRDATSRR